MTEDFSLLTHSLPAMVRTEKRTYGIDPRTCKVLQCFILAEKEEIPFEHRVKAIVEALIGDYGDYDSEELLAVYGKLSEFMNGYPTTARRRKNTAQLLSYEQDHALIVSAFRQAYGIGLSELKNLHWWEFMALLSGVPEDTKLSGVINIRGMEMSAKDTPEQRQAKIKAKQSVAIRPKRKAGADIDGEDIISMALSKED